MTVAHRDGVSWHLAPLPRRWHRCTPWSTATLSTGRCVQRCACGARRDPNDGGGWDTKNSRRRTRVPAAPAEPSYAVLRFAAALDTYITDQVTIGAMLSMPDRMLDDTLNMLRVPAWDPAINGLADR